MQGNNRYLALFKVSHSSNQCLLDVRLIHGGHYQVELAESVNY